MIIDASVILRAYFPDEAQGKAQAIIRDHIAGRLQLKAPSLLPYEVSNAVWQAERRGRINQEQTSEIIASIDGVQIEIMPMEWGEMLPMARRFGRSVYDAAYLALADKMDEPLITGDERLYNSVHASLGWVYWVEDYEDQEANL